MPRSQPTPLLPHPRPPASASGTLACGQVSRSRHRPPGRGTATHPALWSADLRCTTTRPHRGDPRSEASRSAVPEAAGPARCGVTALPYARPGESCSRSRYRRPDPLTFLLAQPVNDLARTAFTALLAVPITPKGLPPASFASPLCRRGGLIRLFKSANCFSSRRLRLDGLAMSAHWSCIRDPV